MEQIGGDETHRFTKEQASELAVAWQTVFMRMANKARLQGYNDGFAGRDLAPPMSGVSIDELRDAYQDGYEQGKRSRI